MAPDGRPPPPRRAVDAVGSLPVRRWRLPAPNRDRGRNPGALRDLGLAPTAQERRVGEPFVPRLVGDRESPRRSVRASAVLAFGSGPPRTDLEPRALRFPPLEVRSPGFSLAVAVSGSFAAHAASAPQRRLVERASDCTPRRPPGRRTPLARRGLQTRRRPDAVYQSGRGADARAYARASAPRASRRAGLMRPLARMPAARARVGRTKGDSRGRGRGACRGLRRARAGGGERGWLRS